MELGSLDPNLHLSSQDIPFCLITCLFASFVCFTCLFAPVWHLLLACLLACFPSICFFACLLVCFLVCCMYTYEARTLETRVRHPKCKQKRARIQARGCKPIKDDVQQIRRPSPSRAVFSFSLSKPLLQSMYQGLPSCTPFLFYCSLLGLRSLDMTMSVLHFLYLIGSYPQNVGNVLFTFLLCVVALCMMYVCVYIYIYIYISACLYMGDCALCMMDSCGYVSAPRQS